MPDPTVPPVVDHIEPDYCPNCGTSRQEGWCAECSRRRQNLMLWMLFLILPILGFGACVAGGFGLDASVSGYVMVAGACLCLASPVIGVVYFIVLQIMRSRRG